MKNGIGVAVAIVRGESILLGRRIAAYGDGLWQTPGGKPDPGESLVDAAIRETLEETGLAIERPVEIARQSDDFKKIDTRYDTIFFGVRCEAGEARNTEPHACEGWSWHDLGALPPASERFAIDDATVDAIRAFAAMTRA